MDAYVPVLQGLEFVQAMGAKEHIDDFVFRAIEHGRDSSPCQNASPKAFSAPPLYAALRRFLEIGHRLNPSVGLSIIRERNELRIESRFAADLDDDKLHIMEWTIILQLLSIVRESLGSDMCPMEIGFQRPFDPCRDVLEQMSNARFLFGQPKTSIAIPFEVLSWSVPGAGSQQSPDGNPDATVQQPAMPVLGFSSSLRLAMRAYLGDGYPHINIAAEIMGVSARTLQRRLAKDGQNYSELIQQARLDVAGELLRRPDLKVIDVAYAAGYEDPSHFSRAFRRISGVTPREFQRHIRALA